MMTACFIALNKQQYSGKKTGKTPLLISEIQATFKETLPLKVLLAFYVFWIVFVLVFQFADRLREWTDAWQFYLGGLLPTWRMFAPKPVDGDFRLYYRVREGGAAFSAWTPVAHPQKSTMPVRLLFNPGMHCITALRDICDEVRRSESDRNVYYQLLLQYLTNEFRRRQPEIATDALQLQFRICAQVGESNTPVYHSHVHPL
jgi:hypothetical protein